MIRLTGGSSHRWVRLLFFAIVLSLSFAPRAAESQDRPQKVILTFYHGAGGKSKAVNTQAPGGVPTLTLDSELDLAMPEGSRVCLQVLNPHPVFYAYSLGRTIDSTQISLPAGANVLLGALNAALGKNESLQESVSSLAYSIRPGRDTTRIDPTVPLWFQTYGSHLVELGKELKRARDAILASNTPEELSYAGGNLGVIADGQNRGFNHAVDTIAALPTGTGHFHDAALDRTLERYRDEAKKAMPAVQTKLDELMFELLSSYGASLLDARNALKKQYGSTRPVHMECVAIGRGLTTVKLKVARRDSTLTAPRDTGSALSTITVTSFFNRPAIEILGTAFAIGARAPKFSVGADGKVVEDREAAFVFRPGTMLVYNPFVWGREKSGALGVTLGFGLLGDNVTFSDFLGGLLISYRDLFRIGAGGGWARLPDRLKGPAKVGEPLPAGIGDLSKLVEQRSRAAAYLTISIAGLTLPTPK